MKTSIKITIASLGLLAALRCGNLPSAQAQESEFKSKLQEDMDGYASRICDLPSVKIEWAGGKLGADPRDGVTPEKVAVSTLCTSGLGAVGQACNDNAVVKEALKGVTVVQCTKGTGPLSYELKGTTLVLSLDDSYVANNVSGQENDLVAKLKRDLDT